MLRLVLVELFKLRRRLMTRVLALLVVALFALLQVVRWNASEPQVFLAQPDVEVQVSGEGPLATPPGRAIQLEPPSPTEAQEIARRARFLEQTVPENLEVLRWLGILFGIMLVAGAFGSEYTWGTLRPFLTCVESRTKYLGAKLIAVAILALLGLVAAMVATVTASLVIASLKGGLVLDFLDGAYVRDGFYDFGRTAFAITPYLLIAALAAVVGRSALPAAVAGLGLLLVESIASPLMERADNWLRHVPDFLLNRNVDAVMGEEGVVVSTNVTGGQVVELILRPPDPWLAALVLGVYALAALLLVWYVFQRRDVTA